MTLHLITRPAAIVSAGSSATQPAAASLVPVKSPLEMFGDFSERILCSQPRSAVTPLEGTLELVLRAVEQTTTSGDFAILFEDSDLRKGVNALRQLGGDGFATERNCLAVVSHVYNSARAAGGFTISSEGPAPAGGFEPLFLRVNRIGVISLDNAQGEKVHFLHFVVLPSDRIAGTIPATRED